nr:RNA-directed DNA polymerase, eukaryota [Tanacetum cinerariifolium]
MAEIVKETSLEPRDDMYTWLLEDDGQFSFSSMRKMIDGNRFQDIMRKISTWWNVDYMDVNSYEEWRSWLVSTRIRSRLKDIIEGIYYGLWWIMWNFLSQVDEASKKDLKDLFQDFYDEYFDSSKIRKSSTTNVETPIIEEVFHKVSKSFQGESSSSSLNNDV